jgi:hypothetical protein
MASMVLRHRGDCAPVVVAERIGQLAIDGKAGGWRSVRGCLAGRPDDARRNIGTVILPPQFALFRPEPQSVVGKNEGTSNRNAWKIPHYQRFGEN